MTKALAYVVYVAGLVAISMWTGTLVYMTLLHVTFVVTP